MTRRRRIAWAIGAVSFALLLAPLRASAHPLGNFTLNHYAGIDISGQQVRVTYVADLAEIPTYTVQQQLIDDPQWLDHQVPTLVAGLALAIDGHPTKLAVLDRSLHFLAGQANLKTTRISILLSAPAGVGSHTLTFRDSTYEGRLGWREVTATASAGAVLSRSDVPARSVSNQLRVYPGDLITSPLDVTTADLTYHTGDAGTQLSSSLPKAGNDFTPIQDRFAALVNAPEVTIPVVLLSLILAVGLGAVHALSPGHGKAVMAAYLVGNRRSARHALLLGGSITVTHTIGVFTLGLITVFFSTFVSPEALYPILTLVSALLILALGLALMARRGRIMVQAFGWSGGLRRAPRHVHSGERGALHLSGHHEHELPPRLGVRSIVAMGVAGGLLPCPSALLVLLAAIQLHRVVYGLVLIVAFSIGLAGVLTGIGVGLATGAPLLQHLPSRPVVGLINRGARLVSVGSAGFIVLIGAVLTEQAVRGVIG